MFSGFGSLSALGVLSLERVISIVVVVVALSFREVDM